MTRGTRASSQNVSCEEKTFHQFRNRYNVSLRKLSPTKFECYTVYSFLDISCKCFTGWCFCLRDDAVWAVKLSITFRQRPSSQTKLWSAWETTPHPASTRDPIPGPVPRPHDPMLASGTWRKTDNDPGTWEFFFCFFKDYNFCVPSNYPTPILYATSLLLSSSHSILFKSSSSVLGNKSCVYYTKA